MNYMNWATKWAASSAYTEASRAGSEIATLLEDYQRFRDELEFQKWVEELIYQFNKTVTAISDYPGNLVADYLDLASFLRFIDRTKLDTSKISGLENKEKFEQTILKAKRLLEKLEKTSEVEGYVYEEKAKQMQLKEEEKRLKAKD